MTANSTPASSTLINDDNIHQLDSAFHSYDGTRIFYRAWLPEPMDAISKNADSKVLLLLHRGHEHSARLTEMAHAFVQTGYAVFAWDARGNGLSAGERDHADSFGQLVRDLDEFASVVSTQTQTPPSQMLLCASSLGALIASTWVHDYAPDIRGMILGTPALAIRLYVPMALPALQLAQKTGLVNRVSSYVKAQVLTHDKDAQNAYNSDPLISHSISRDLLIDSLVTGKRLIDDAGAITTPTMVLCAGKDYVVDKGAIRTFYERLSSPIKRWAYYPDSYHAVFHELNRKDVFADCIAFADALFAKVHAPVDLTAAHTPTCHADSYSQERVNAFMAKGQQPQFALTRLAIERFGSVSDAVATGLRHGFDSGSSLDKVYQNQPAGNTAFGRLVDAFYLNNIGWQGIRIRKAHLLELAELALRNLAKDTDAKPVHLLDIASGNGYYAFELAEQHPTLHGELRDYDAHNINVMSAKIHDLGLSARLTAIQKDAFDAGSYESEAFELAIASGVFELFSDNTLVATALAGMAKSLKAGGYLLYTNQPWHPEQEFIGKTLGNHQGKDWVMRCRTQAEMDQLVVQAGLSKITQRIDRYGIFTVALAQKLPA